MVEGGSPREIWRRHKVRLSEREKETGWEPVYDFGVDRIVGVGTVIWGLIVQVGYTRLCGRWGVIVREIVISKRRSLLMRKVTCNEVI